jgi:CheY-like chemotaxis protein
MVTDAKRLQQVLKNLLSNAFKFTHQGSVFAHVGPWSDRLELRQRGALNRAPSVLAFSVTDTGIGISADKQQIIFEAFQQADGSTSRKYGGTGLGWPSAASCRTCWAARRAGAGNPALTMAREFKPHAITLDISLPDIDGWRVLDRLKHDLATRHIPVYVVSTDESRERALQCGALGFVPKPIQTKTTLESLLESLEEFLDRDVRNVLVVASNPEHRGRFVEHLADEGVEITAVDDGAAALRAIQGRRFDCVVTGFEPLDFDWKLLGKTGDGSPVATALPFIVFSDREPVVDEDGWKRIPQPAIVRVVQSPERLIDQALFCLHRPLAQLPERKRRMLQDLHESDRLLAGRRVLIVDDDMRNIFALSTVLEEHDMMIVSADTAATRFVSCRTNRTSKSC